VKIVLDTNVLVSGLLSARGNCGQIIELMVAGELTLCIDGRIFAEYGDVLHRAQLAIPARCAAEILDLIQSVAEPVAASPIPAKLPDLDDLPFLEVAAKANAILVTGNLRHFPRKYRAGATIVNPAEFLNLMRTL